VIQRLARGRRRRVVPRRPLAPRAVDQALAALDRNASPKIVADWLALQI